MDNDDANIFRLFTKKKFKPEIKNILDNNNSKYLWGLHESKTKSNWSKIKMDDVIYFGFSSLGFKNYGIVKKKLIDKNLGVEIYPNKLNSKKINHFLFFEKLFETYESFSDLKNYSILKNELPIPGIYKIDKQFFKSEKKNFVSKKFKTPKYNGPPIKEKGEVSRFVRDVKKVNNLKKLYKNKCQICQDTFQKQNKNEFYSEVHHYRPLEEFGDDDENNMIVVCPNHHARFDFKVIFIDTDMKTIKNYCGEKTGEIIKFNSKHYLDEKNILSQLG